MHDTITNTSDGSGCQWQSCNECCETKWLLVKSLKWFWQRLGLVMMVPPVSGWQINKHLIYLYLLEEQTVPSTSGLLRAFWAWSPCVSTLTHLLALITPVESCLKHLIHFWKIPYHNDGYVISIANVSKKSLLECFWKDHSTKEPQQRREYFPTATIYTKIQYQQKFCTGCSMIAIHSEENK